MVAAREMPRHPSGGVATIDLAGSGATTRLGYRALTRTGYGRPGGAKGSMPIDLKPANITPAHPEMTRLTPLAQLRVPLGAQEIELQQFDFDGGGMSLLRTRIREGSRFTIFDIDPATAEQWGQALLDWARGQPRE